MTVAFYNAPYSLHLFDNVAHVELVRFDAVRLADIAWRPCLDPSRACRVYDVPRTRIHIHAETLSMMETPPHLDP